MKKSRTYPNLTETECIKLGKHCKEKNIEETSASIDWGKVLDPSDDPNPERADAINKARITSVKRYQKQGGPKVSKGSNAKKPKIILPEKRVEAIRELHRRK